MSAPTTTLCQFCIDGVDYRYGDLVVICGACGGTGRIDAPHLEDDMAEAMAESDFWSRVGATEGTR